MKIFEKFKGLISSIDMFKSSEMLRYDNDTQHKTFTGGIMTSIIIVMVSISFFAMISDTLNRTAINSSLTVSKNQNPPRYDLVIDQSHKFMFGLQIQSLDSTFTLNLTQETRYFDVVMKTQQFNYGVLTNETDHSLVQCTDQHWKIIPGMVEKSEQYGYSTWLCPQIGQTLPIQGSYTSQKNLITMIIVNPCRNQTNLNQVCAPQHEIDNLMNAYQNFYMTVNYINPVINPTKTNFISYYLQGQDYVIFSQTQGSQAWIQFSDYQITTDNSILPLSQYTNEVGVIVQTKAINHPFAVTNVTGYVNLYFSKSSNSLNYQRDVQKISAVFSYIGGLVGAMTAVLFLMKTYTDTSLELTIAIGLFKEPQDQQDSKTEKKDQHQIQASQKAQNYVPLQKQSFNLKNFVKLMAYEWFSAFNFTKKWKSAKMLYEFRKEIVKQLDIKNLLRRLISIQSCMDILFNQDQLQSLKYRKNVDLYKAKKLRQLLVPANQGEINSRTQTNFNNKIQNEHGQKQLVELQSISSPKMLQQFTPTGQKLNKNTFNQFAQSSRNSVLSSEKSIQRYNNQNNSSIHLKKLRDNASKASINQRIWYNLKESTKKQIDFGFSTNKVQPVNTQKLQTLNKVVKEKKPNKIRFEDTD